MRATFTLLLLLALSPRAEAQEAGHDEASPPDSTAAQPPAPTDPLTQHMTLLVARYYQGIAAEPSTQELANGLESIRLMVLSSIPLPQVEAAIDRAVLLHTPGRHVPFEIAVPLRVQAQPAGPTPSSRTPVRRTPVKPTLSAEEQERIEAEELAREEARSRSRLYRQWQERTRTRRTLVSIGAPVLAGSYALTFGAAGGAQLEGVIDHEVAWLAVIPLGGGIAVGAASGGELPGFFVLSGLQIAGAAVLLAGAVMKVDWPYDRDPKAYRSLPRRPKSALSFRLLPAPNGALLLGRF